jgi:hypothetical protein
MARIVSDPGQYSRTWVHCSDDGNTVGRHLQKSVDVLYQPGELIHLVFWIV